IDADGNATIFNIVELKNAVASDYKISVYAHSGASYILFYNGLQQQKINIQISDLQGKKLYAYNTSVNQGDNQIQLPSNIRGIIIVTITTEDGRRTSAKVGIMQ
ncbi:MAG: T9SS type A sorting domain-containing protein, partial [Panacibacter sp.]